MSSGIASAPDVAIPTSSEPTMSRTMPENNARMIPNRLVVAAIQRWFSSYVANLSPRLCDRSSSARASSFRGKLATTSRT
jgi:hypothetical protein